jgi:galactokinase
MNTTDLIAQFERCYGFSPTVIARAPGRIEFIGNHTDYNGGAVLGAAINRYVWVTAAPANAGQLRFCSGAESPIVDFPADRAGKASGAEAWVNYPLGLWRSLKELSLPRPDGFALLVSSDLPQGAGLSSSAALELATALALLQLANGASIGPAALAALGRHAENVHVGVPCGILDQGTSAFGRVGQLVHIDCREPKFSLVPLPDGARFWIFNTREKHALIDGLYATRHQECQAAATILGVKWLVDAVPEKVEQAASLLGPILTKRARHIVGEHSRVGATVTALQRGDLPAGGKLLTASHQSSRFQFENSTPALDTLVDSLVAQPGVLGARLTGGGFGGAVLALANDEFSISAAQAVAQHHVMSFGRSPEILHLQTADGAQVL